MQAKQLEKKTKKAKQIVSRCVEAGQKTPRWVNKLLKIK